MGSGEVVSVEDSLSPDDPEGNIRRMTLRLMQALEMAGFSPAPHWYETIEGKVRKIISDMESIYRIEHLYDDPANDVERESQYLRQDPELEIRHGGTR